MGARIPESLIPSDERKPVNRKTLVFAGIVALLFAIPFALLPLSGSLGSKKAKLSSNELLWVGFLSAYFCQVNSSRLSPEQGRVILKNLITANSLPRSVVENKILRDVALLNSQTFSNECSPTRPDGDNGISEIYARVIDRK